MLDTLVDVEGFSSDEAVVPVDPFTIPAPLNSINVAPSSDSTSILSLQVTGYQL
jgi:hypothetical protein